MDVPVGNQGFSTGYLDIRSGAKPPYSPIRMISTEAESTKNPLHYLNLRFMGVGFRGYIIKKIVNVHKLSKEQKKLASRWLDKSEHDGTSFIRVLILKLGQSALTAYPIPVGVTVLLPD